MRCFLSFAILFFLLFAKKERKVSKKRIKMKTNIKKAQLKRISTVGWAFSPTQKNKKELVIT